MYPVEEHQMSFKTSVGVAKDKILGETNDCGVIGLANATGLSYVDIHSRLRAKGRRNRRGTKVHMVSAVLADLKAEGIVTEFKSVLIGSGVSYMLRAQRQTVAGFLRTLPRTGRFFLCCTTHAFAYVNGEMFDNIQGGKQRARMQVALQVTMAGQVAPPPAVVAPQPKPEGPRRSAIWTPPAVVAPIERPRFDAEEYQRRAIAARLAAQEAM
jgi:hypothetical protein